jgi:hypothetical protein
VPSANSYSDFALPPLQRLFFEPEIDFPQFGSTGGPDRIVNAFEREYLTVFDQLCLIKMLCDSKMNDL